MLLPKIGVKKPPWPSGGQVPLEGLSNFLGGLNNFVVFLLFPPFSTACNAPDKHATAFCCSNAARWYHLHPFWITYEVAMGLEPHGTPRVSSRACMCTWACTPLHELSSSLHAPATASTIYTMIFDATEHVRQGGFGAVGQGQSVAVGCGRGGSTVQTTFTGNTVMLQDCGAVLRP